MKLRDRTAVITGAARGTGRAIAERFIQEGARVLLADIDEAALMEAAVQLQCPMRLTDVGNADSIRALIESAIVLLGQVDILVNNAGVVHAADFLEVTEEDFDRVLHVNLRSAFIASQSVARHMIARASGVIINMSSVNAVLAIPNQVAYAVSRGGLSQLTKVSALALAPYGIRVNGIGPGTINTQTAQTIAAFLASDDASYLTGQTLYQDGGRLALNYTVDVPAALPESGG